MERGSPKSCFLYLGEVLCEVNWLSVLSDHFQATPVSTACPAPPDTHNESHMMLVYLLYMLVFLAKEEQMLSQKVSPQFLNLGFNLFFFHSSISDDFLFLLNLQDSPLFSLLVQSTSLPCYQVDLSSYQGILGYVSTHYPASLLLAGDSAPQLLLKVLRCAAGLQHSANEVPNTVRKCSAASFASQITDLLMSLLDFSRTLTSPRCDCFVGQEYTDTASACARAHSGYLMCSRGIKQFSVLSWFFSTQPIYIS